MYYKTMKTYDLNNDELSRQITNNIKPKENIRHLASYLKNNSG